MAKSDAGLEDPREDFGTAKGGSFLPATAPSSEFVDGAKSCAASVTVAFPGGPDSGNCRSFSHLLAGSIETPAGGSQSTPILAVPLNSVRITTGTVPCVLPPAALLDSQSFMETCTPETEQTRSSDRNSHSVHINPKTFSDDGYNWRKYGQKQVKSTDRARSYYRCTKVNCFAKKKVERCPSGRITEVIYGGQHNHDQQLKAKNLNERGLPFTEHIGANEVLDTYSHESDPSSLKVELKSNNETPQQELPCSIHCEGSPATKAEEDVKDEPDPKRRQGEGSVSNSTPVPKIVEEPTSVVQTVAVEHQKNDGYRWRKYGRKFVKGNMNQRCYYRCTHNGCRARKHVELPSDNPRSLLISYKGKHNHDLSSLRSYTDTLAASVLIYEQPSSRDEKSSIKPPSEA